MYTDIYCLGRMKLCDKRSCMTWATKKLGHSDMTAAYDLIL